MSKFILNGSIEREIEKISKAAKFIWQKGWAERNGGNISVNLTEMITHSNIDTAGCRYTALRNFPKELSEKVFFVTGTGERIRDLDKPEDSSCIIRFDRDVNGYHIIWGGLGKEEFRPTSELISHAMIHLEMERSPRGYTTLLHTHPAEMIALSHHPALNKNAELFNNNIWSMLPEVRLFVPRGVALVPYVLPGSLKLAELTLEALRSHDVALWIKHGAVAAGKDIMESFDFIDVANKGCAIYMNCLSSGFTPEGLTPQEMDELIQVYKPSGI